MDFDFSACVYVVNAKIRLSYILYPATWFGKNINNYNIINRIYHCTNSLLLLRAS